MATLILELVLSLVTLLNFILGIIVLMRSFREKFNLFFGLICLAVCIWSVGILGFYVAGLSFIFPNVWTTVTHTSALFIALMFVYFALNFPKKLTEKAYVYILTSLPFLVVLYFLFFTREIIGKTNGFTYEINFGYIFYAFCILVYFLIGYLFLFIQYKRSTDRIQKIQIRYVTIGVTLASMLASATDLILPFLGVFDYNWLGPVFTFIMVGFIAFAILKYHLFHIKIVITESFTFLIWFLLLFKLVFSQSYQDFLLNAILLALIVMVGILLIRSMLKELQQKEQIEDYAMRIERAYEVEKKSKEELEILDKSKNQFMMAIQHHLRTPLTQMMGYSDLILNGTFGKQNKNTIEAANNIQTSAKNLIKMVNDFLDVTQFQLGKDMVTLKDGVDICSILQEIQTELKFEADKKEIALEFKNISNPILIKADREKIKAAIYNIIDNAVKYTPNGNVVVELSPGSKLVLSVKDSGIGIAKENISNLFGKTFERGEAAKKTFINGRGIGLYITNQIIKSHNGRIWAESEGEGKGSTFFIELPC